MNAARPSSFAQALRRAFFLASLLAVITGCSPDRPDAAAIELGKTPYPESAAYAEDLDIVATQHGGTLHFDNRTPIVLKNVQLWVNQQYVQNLPVIDIGNDSENNDVDLTTLVNRYGEPYPIGGFLTPDKTFPVVLVEVFVPETGKRHRLLTRPRKPL